MFTGGGFGDLFDAFFGGGGSPFGGGGRGGPAGPPRGQDLEVVADITLRAGCLRRRRWRSRFAPRCAATNAAARAPARAPSRSPARSATAAVRCNECVRACSARWSRRQRLPALWRPRSGHRHALRAPAPAKAGSSPRRPIRSTCRPASTPARPCGSPVAVLSGRVVAVRATCTCTSVSPLTRRSPATATTSLPICRSRSRRPRSAPSSRCRRSTVTKRSSVPAGTQHGQGVRVPATWRAPPARSRPWRPAGADQRSGADQAHRVRDRAAHEVRRVTWRVRRQHRARPVLAHQIRLLVNPVLRGSARARVRRRRSRHRNSSDDDDHHLRPCAAHPRRSDVITVERRRRAMGRWRRWRPIGVPVESDPIVRAEPRRGGGRSAAIPKGDRPEWIVQKLTEIGATSIGFMRVRAQRGAMGRRARPPSDRAVAPSRPRGGRCRAGALWLPAVRDVVPFADARQHGELRSPSLTATTC